MNTRVFLICSLVANVALAASVIYIFKQVPESPEIPPFIVQAGFSSTNEAKPANTEAQAGNAEKAAQFDWRRVESSDYRQYIANLRAIGCPEETIRDIIVADVKKLFVARAKEMGSTNRFEYWRGGNPLGNLLNEETITRQQDLAKEKRELLKTLLGKGAPVEVESSLAAANIYESMLDFLPTEKQNQIKDLEEKFAGKMMSTVKKASEGDTSALRAVQAEKDAELLKLLTPEEKLEYDVRMSQTAMFMRMQMGDLELSENEFREVFQVRKALDDQFGMEGMGVSGKAEQEKREAAKKEANAKIASILGDRYPEYKYEMGGEWAAQMLHRIARDNNVPRENALKAYAITDQARSTAETIKAEAGQPEDRKNAVLQSIYNETAQSLTQVLGQPAADAYLKKVALIPGFKTASR